MQRIREAIIPLARPDKMMGPVEIDGVYIGCLEKNKHADKKGTTCKVAVVVVGDWHSNSIPGARNHRGKIV